MGIIKFMSQALDSVLEILKTMPLESPLKSLSLSKNSKKTLEIWFSMGCTHMETFITSQRMSVTFLKIWSQIIRPPGCGKTMMARAVSKEMGFRFLVVKPSVVNNKWVGESEKTIQAIFSLGIGFQTKIWYVAYDIVTSLIVWYLTKKKWITLNLWDKNSGLIICHLWTGWNV